jgi:uncharacterized secreted protein with C-terminal beta-propeller domain/predicted transcriptional regulator
MKKAKKFIFMDLNDEKAKQVANNISNDTSRKVLDYLAGVEEASETEISRVLNLPISTIHYNLQNLKKAGLVEVKQFSWSRKGKKMDYYRAAEKHIIISPKKAGPNMKVLSTFLPILAVLIVASALIGLFFYPYGNQWTKGEMNTFNSVEEMKSFLEKHQLSGSGDGRVYSTGIVPSTLTAKSSEESSQDSSGAGESAGSYSSTNIQVAGVDEADIIKNDGKYVYLVSGNKLLIVDAYPAGSMKILSEIEFSRSKSSSQAPLELFINKDKLVLFTSIYEDYAREGDVPEIQERVKCFAAGCGKPMEEKTGIIIYDISNRENPVIEKEMSVSGYYLSSRMVGEYVYLISNQHLYEDILLPVIKDGEIEKEIEPSSIYYDEVEDYSFQNTIILAVNLENGETTGKALLSGTTQDIYVSNDNIYAVSIVYPRSHPILYARAEDSSDSSDEKPAPDKEEAIIKTRIQKISIKDNSIEHVATGEVPGQILNQFSMDEFDGNFRIATTMGEVWDTQEKSSNNVYVLDDNLKIIGSLEGLAPGERIYSVRFMGKRGYMVTFKKVDPLFVLDFSSPESPKVLGKLKIPGYSDYLHPYDENHIIGVGKEAVDAEDESGRMMVRDFAWYQGMKIAIFDVSDVENPKEIHKVVIGDRGTDSEALYEHKAFLFDREKKLLVLPITLAEIKGERTDDSQYGEQVFQGAFVYELSLEDGFVEKGRITHYSEEDYLKMGYYFYGNKNIRRALYMDNTLYTVSDSMIKANELWGMEEKGSVSWKLGNEYPVVYEEAIVRTV